MTTVAVLGSLNMDVVLRVAAMPRPGETINAASLMRSPGGKGANQAVAAARAGAAVRMLGAVGDDSDGAAMVAALEESGVDCGALLRLGDRPTGTALIVVDDHAENMIVVAGGANLAVEPAPAPAAAVRLAQLETPLAAIDTFFAEANGLTMLNAAPFEAAALPLLQRADSVVVNEHELAGYAAAAVPKGAEAAAALAAGLLTRAGQWIVATLGAEGAVAVSREQTLFVAGTPAARVIDTTGAGDCFCGVLAAGLAQGMQIGPALERAGRAAALSVGRIGAIPAMPMAAEFDAG